MNVVVGCPVKDRAWVLGEWFDAIQTQGVEVSVITLLSPSQDNTELILRDRGAHIIYDEEVGRSTTDIDNHIWGDQSNYEYMANLRNRLIDTCVSLDVDYFFSLDSDIILPPNALTQMLQFAESHAGIVAPAVNMVTGSPVWNVMNWVDKYRPGRADRTVVPIARGQADVVMAAMMLDRDGMRARWESHSQGEDVGFCLDAYSKQIPCWWLPEIICEHWMRHY